ncbi:MAG: hypothetical protein ABI042_20105 [Verrucomicrobiota bacterium]
MADAPKNVTAETLNKFPTYAWQPFTPRGVAAFATAPSWRAVILKIIVALVASFTVVWFCRANYFPSIYEAIKNLPDGAALQNKILVHFPSGALTQRKFLSVIVDSAETGAIGQTADVQVELRKTYFQICSIFGCGLFEYPEKNIALNRSSVEAWWGARQPVILVLIASVAGFTIWMTWIFLGLIYAPVAKLIAYFNDRELSWSGSWRLASAVQMPGAILMCLTILFYGLQTFDLIRFLFFFTIHFFVAWIYLFWAPFSLPPIKAAISPTQNPFTPP